MGSVIVQFGGGEKGLATLALCGGKAVNLVRLATAGLPVPAGFVLTTDAYRAFVTENGLDELARREAAGLDPADVGSLEAASARIRAAFRAGSMPPPVREQLAAAAEPYAGVPVAVRSSATAEDLPDLSFAGQQDTYLNVIGADDVDRAVVECWSSLWTARAIGYRIRAGIPHDDVALAVVVQRMVASEVSGVMFTADPLDGRRDRVVIDATYGLGEALVSGLVEPDHYVVADGGVVLERTAGAKTVQTVARTGGGVDTVDRATTGLALTDPQLVELAAMGRRVEAGYGVPQDIEWAFAGGRLHVVQSRAVTSLYPLPDPAAGPGEPVWDGLPAWLSFGGFQGMLEPITPLGQDALVLLARSVFRLFGSSPGPYSLTSLPAVRVAGERLWLRVDRALRTDLGSRLLPAFLGVGDPAARALLDSLDEPSLRPQQKRGIEFAALRSGLPLLLQVAAAVPALVRDPVSVRVRLERECEGLVEAASSRERAASAAASGADRLHARLDALEASTESAFSVLLPRFGPIMVTGVLTQRLLTALGGTDALATLRATSGNVTTAMDLDLWRVAEVVRAEADWRTRFSEAAPADLAADFAAGRLPIPVTIALTGFLERWGMRGVGEIDLGHPRWADDPAAVVASLQSYVALSDDSVSPAAAYERGRTDSAEALARLTAELSRRGLRGRCQAGLVRFLVARVRATFGARETPKFTLVRMLGIARGGLIASGAELAEAGRLGRAEDVLLLHLAQLRRAWTTAPEELLAVVAERRAAQQREARRRQVPRLMLGDGRTFYEGVPDPGDGSIGGSPVSPGVAEGSVRVVLSPAEAGLLPGEILVCAGTDPAWTPLFLTAAGLVTEVGGMMTHGSVVAREYGLPAVVGVHDATTRLRTGMRIRLDGAAGTITVLDDSRTS